MIDLALFTATVLFFATWYLALPVCLIIRLGDKILKEGTNGELENLYLSKHYGFGAFEQFYKQCAADESFLMAVTFFGSVIWQVCSLIWMVGEDFDLTPIDQVIILSEAVYPFFGWIVLAVGLYLGAIAGVRFFYNLYKITKSLENNSGDKND